MRITPALPSLIFLLFAFFFPQHLTLAQAENVLDMSGHPLVPGKQYHILDAKNTARGIQTEHTRDDTGCPISVIVGADAKKVIFHSGDEHAESITLGEDLDIEFAEVSQCAKSGNWSVEYLSKKEYPVVIGPPDGAISFPGVFFITKSEDLSKAYYVGFKFEGKVDYILRTSPYRFNQEIYNVGICPREDDEKFNVVFEPYKQPTPSPSPPPPPPPPEAPTPTPGPAPAPTSTFVPLIRKIVR